MENNKIDTEVTHETLFSEYGIYEKLRELKKYELLFNYDKIDELEDLKLFSQSILSQSVMGVVRTDTKPIKVRYTSSFEKEQSLTAQKKEKTNIGLDEVHYTVSSLGYRLTNPIESIYNGMGIFGCSITYGIGVPEHRTFSALLQNTLNKPIHNFGVPGGSIQKIRKSFISINNFFKLKEAIFVLPSMGRYELMGEEQYRGNPGIFSETYIPNYLPVNTNRIEFYKMLYTHFDDISFLDEFIKNLQLIVFNAKLNNTKLTFYTWDYKLQNLAVIYNIEELKNSPKIRFPENEENVQHPNSVRDFARDGLHPGYRGHNSVYEVLLSDSFKKNLKII